MIDQPELFGRDDDLRRLTGLLAEHSMVTVLGPGGVGKTRLALEVTRRLRIAGRHVTFVDLSGLHADAFIASEIAAALGDAVPGGSPEEDIVRALAAHDDPVLVVDNLEQLPGAGDVLSRIVGDSPRVHVVATSRRAVAPGLEATMRLAALRLPSTSEPSEVMSSPATALFLARARDVGGLATPGPDELADIAGLCRKLDGLPLAIELAAARTRLLAPAAIARRLEAPAGSALLRRSAGPERHGSLQAVLEWSLALLGEDDRRVLSAVAVFRGPFDLAMAAAVVPWTDPLPSLERLAEAALVQHEPDPSGEPRIRLLQTIRLAALDRLTPEEAALSADRHVAAIRAAVRREREALLGADHAHSAARLAAIIEDVRAAHQSAIASRPADAIDLVADVWRFWCEAGRGAEGLARLREALQAERGATAARARGLAALAGLVHMTESDRRAAEPAAAAIRLARRLREPAIELEALPAATLAALSAGDGLGSMRLARRSIVLARRLGDGRALVRAMTTLGLAEGLAGNVAGGAARIQAAATEARNQGDPLNEAIQLSNLAAFNLLHGQPGKAIGAAASAVTLLRGLRADVYLLISLAYLGHGLAELGRLQPARAALREAATLALDVHQPGPVNELLVRAQPYLRRVGATLTLAHGVGASRRLRRLIAPDAPDPGDEAGIAELRTSLGLESEALIAAVQAGQTMDPTAVIRELLDVLERGVSREAGAPAGSAFVLTPRETEVLRALVARRAPRRRDLRLAHSPSARHEPTVGRH